MKSKIVRNILMILIVLTIGVFASLKYNNDRLNTNFIEGTIISSTKDTITIKDDNNVLYTFNYSLDGYDVGDIIILEYMGVLNHIKDIQDNDIVSSELVKSNDKEENTSQSIANNTSSSTSSTTSSTSSSNSTSKKNTSTSTTSKSTTSKKTGSSIVSSTSYNGIFNKFYDRAISRVKTMSLDEKIKQVLLIRYSDSYVADVGGYIFFGRDFKNKNESQVKKMISTLQDKSKVPFLIAVDEEGGTVVRVSSNTNLRSSKYKAPKDIYDNGGMNAITADTIDKSNFLHKFGINVNLAPVVDIADDPSAYMYKRTIGYGKDITSEYARTVINASKGTGVSYALKHFPGYGNNDDTHISSAKDIRSYDELMGNDIVPFSEGIKAGAEAVLVSHNIINSVDSKNPASLSRSVHNILTKDLNFTGIIITDDLDMGATKNISKKYVKAINSGNDLLIVTDYNTAYKELKNAISNKEISESLINDAATKIVAWKYYKGLFQENDK